VGFHWAELLVRRDARDIARIVEKSVADVTGRRETVLFSEGNGSRFYRRSLTGAGLWIGWANVTRGKEDRCHFTIKGEAWDGYGAEAMGRVLEVLWRDVVDVLRVDVAFDGLAVTPREWWEAWEAGKAGSRQVDYLENSRGQAAWLGKLYSGSNQVCMYDERGPVRLEFRTRKRDVGSAIVKAWVEGGGLKMANQALAGLRVALEGSWGVLQAWCGEGPKLYSAPERHDLGDGVDARAPAAAKTLVIFGLRHGWGELARILAEAAKWIPARELDLLQVDGRAVAPMWGRIGPNGTNDRVREVAGELAAIIAEAGLGEGAAVAEG
jgi:hypothetical protein